MSSTSEVLYKSARSSDFVRLIPNSSLPYTLCSFEERDLAKILKVDESGDSVVREVAGVTSGIQLRKFIIDPLQDPWLDSVPSFDAVREGQKFLLDKVTAANIPWLVDSIKERRDLAYIPNHRRNASLEHFLLYKIAAGTRISPPYVLDPDIDPDGHVVIRTNDYSNTEDPEFVLTKGSDRYYSRYLADDLSQAEYCGVLLVASRNVGEIQWPTEKVSDMDTPNEGVLRFVRALSHELHDCSLEDFELLTGWMEKAERANYALSCVQELDENNKLYEAVWAAAIYETQDLNYLIYMWRQLVSAVEVSGFFAIICTCNLPLLVNLYFLVFFRTKLRVSQVDRLKR